jgi:protein-S-isoprenylcysteine O-methyltransferase Ste14
MALAYLINPRFLRWSSLPIPAWLRWVGAVVGVLAVPPLLFWVFHHLGKNLTDTVAIRREHCLVTSGPYRWVRHPFYGVAFLAILSLSLVLANWFVALLGFVVVILLAIRTRIEEEKLVQRFGDSYKVYRERTGRYIPRLRRRTIPPVES